MSFTMRVATRFRRFPEKLVSLRARMNSTDVAPKMKTDLFEDGNQRFMTQYLDKAFSQDDPNMTYFDGARGDLDFSSCDYLALAEHPELNRIEGEYIRDQGSITHNRSGAYPRNANSLVTQLEDQLAEWQGGADAYMTNSGTEANVNIMQLILGETNMPIYIDKYAHATFLLGAKAAGRKDALYFKHNCPDDLLKMIKENGPGLVCIDTLYSALGTVAKLDEIVDICKKYNCTLIADEAHAVGIIGKEGEGFVKSKGLENDVPFRTFSLGKVFGSGAGSIVFSKETAEGKKLIPHLCSMAIFSLAPQDSKAARHMKGLEMIRKEQWRRDELNEKTEFFRKGCIERGYDGYFVKNGFTNIVPFVVGKVDFAKTVYDLFVKQKFYPSPHFYPMSPRSKSVVRFTICNFHSTEHLQSILDLLEEIKPIVKPWEWPDQKSEISNFGFYTV